MAQTLEKRKNVRGEVSKVYSKRHVEEIWLAELRLKALSRQLARAIVTEDFELAKGIKEKCTGIQQDIFVKYAVILDRV